jgi:predicted nucleic acid-binding protein
MKFVDTSFWVALQLTHDARHDIASRLWMSDLGSLLTTNHVVGETWTFLRRRAGHRPAAAFIRALGASPRVQAEHVTAEVEEEAWKWLMRHDERTYSFVDATSFMVMRRRRIRGALAFDGDFSAAGYEELR